MKFKLDENFGTRTQPIFKKAGHTVKTVRDQGLQGCKDRKILTAETFRIDPPN